MSDSYFISYTILTCDLCFLVITYLSLLLFCCINAVTEASAAVHPAEYEIEDSMDEEDNNILLSDNERHDNSSDADNDDSDNPAGASSSKPADETINKFCRNKDQQSDSDSSEVEPLPKLPRLMKKTQRIVKTSKKQKKLGEDLSSSLNTDLYSSDEERPPKHKNKVRANKSSLFEDDRVMDECSECKGDNKMPHIVFEISGDGVRIQKKAVKSAAWPLMGQLLYISPCIHLQDRVRFYFPRNSSPVIIGFYHGTTKPKSAKEYLRLVFKEMHLAQLRGLCTSFLKYYIGDGPSQQFIKGFPSSTAYCGCEQ